MNEATGPSRLLVAAFLHGFGESSWVSLDGVMALLETVGRHLEGGNRGARFPLLWRIALALGSDGSYEWTPEELEGVVRELDTIERETESVPAALTPLFAFSGEEFPDVYSRETPRADGSARSRFQSLIDDLKAIVRDAQRRRRSVSIERRGPAVEWWDA